MNLTSQEIETLLELIKQQIIDLTTTWEMEESKWPEDFDANDITIYQILQKDYANYLATGCIPYKNWKGNTFLIQDLQKVLSEKQQMLTTIEIRKLKKLITFLSNA